MNDKTTDAVADYIESPFGVKVPTGDHLGVGHRARIQSGDYEAPEVVGVAKVVREGDRLLECGAGVGLVGAIAAVVGKPAAVLSFEANPGLIKWIEALYKLNGLENIMSVRNQILLAGPNQPESVSFSVRGNYLGSRMANNKPRGRIVDIPTADYAKVAAEFRPTVIIMDIEGGEMDFLMHADLTGVRALVVEFHPDVYGIPEMRVLKNALIAQGFQRLGGSTRVVWAMERGGPGTVAADDE